jgi:serine/threonine protein phosphatase PrpC
VVRDHNEDSAYVDPQHQFFIVADGMGGHAAGEVASAMAVETVRSTLEEAREELAQFAQNPTDDGRKALVSLLEFAVRKAHEAVYERGLKESDKQGMGTTLDVLVLAGAEAFVAHVGDSRTYLVREGKAAQITTDHTVAEVLVIEGKLSAEEAQISPLRTILVNALGVAPDVGVEMAHVRLKRDDQLLLCSDGLHDYFPLESEIAEHLRGIEPAGALTEMIELAKGRGGHDNITGVLLKIVECDADTTEELSDGVPRPVNRDDTLPVEPADRARGPAQAASQPASPATGDRPESAGTAGTDAAAPAGAAGTASGEPAAGDRPESGDAQASGGSGAAMAATAEMPAIDAGATLTDDDQQQRRDPEITETTEDLPEGDTLIGYDPHMGRKPTVRTAGRNAGDGDR